MYFLRQILIMSFITISFGQDIKDIMNKLKDHKDLFKMGDSDMANKLAISIVRAQIKEEFVKNLRTGIDSMKKDANLYTGENKETIDQIEYSLSSFAVTSNDKVLENKYFNQMIEGFRKLARLAGSKQEQRRMENFVTVIEHGMGYLMNNTDEIGKNISEAIKELKKSENGNSRKEDFLEPDSSDDEEEEEGFLTTEVIVIITLISIILAALIMYAVCKAKRRISNRSIEYMPHLNESSIIK